MKEEKLNCEEVNVSINNNEERKKSNILINILILIIIFFISVIMYAKYVGVSGIRVKEYRIADELIPINFSGVKIVYFSDILVGSTIDTSDIKEMVELINELKPDIILFGGGLVYDGYSLEDDLKQSIIDEFNKLNVKLGKYAVKGFNDDDVFDEIMTLSNFKVMDNSYEFIYNEDVTPICLSAVGSYNIGSYNLEKSFEFFNTNVNCYTVVFTHESDIIDNIMAQEHKPNVIFAGNTLGGEVNIPFVGPIAKMEGSTKYYLDYYEIENTQIYISSGFGTRKYDMRLFNHPSFNFFRLKSLNEK